MAGSQLIDDLLLEWDERRRLSIEVSVEELTSGCPELADQLREQVEALKSTDWLEDTHDGEPDPLDTDASIISVRAVVTDSPVSRDEFLNAITQAEILASDDMNAYLKERDQHASADAQTLAQDMVSSGLLTPYQAQSLLQGRGGQLVIDKYLILDSLGAGGMGVVFKALHRPMNRVVALKMISPQFVDSPDKQRRFRREVRVAAALSHPNIVTAHDADESNGVHFLVMEYVSGRDLDTLVRRKGPMTVAQAVDCISQAARGLQHAHDQGIVHRDVKPRNLMLSDEGVVKLLDLGLARLESGLFVTAAPDAGTQPDTIKLNDRGGLTSDGALMGTVAFMAPEQAIDGRNVDQRTDIYSLGCTLYFLLIGEPPYEGANPIETVMAHREAEPPSMRRVRPDVPEALDQVVQRMIAKKPDDRFQTAKEVVAALSPYVQPQAAEQERAEPGRVAAAVTPPKRLSQPRRTALRWAAAMTSVAAVILLVAFWPTIGDWYSRKKPDTNSDKSAQKPNQQPEATVVTIPNGFTVAKDGTGQFTTIGEALKRIDRPGMTIRIRDDATYSEALDLADKTLHKGLTLESPRRATLAVPAGAAGGIVVREVSDITLRGIRVHMKKPAKGIAAIGHCSGLVVEGVDVQFQPTVPTRIDAPGATGILIQGSPVGAPRDARDKPMTVRRCRVTGCQIGIFVLGIWLDRDPKQWRPLPCRDVIVHDNRISDARHVGLFLRGHLSHVQISGNQVWNCSGACCYLADLYEGSGKILIANNSMWNGAQCLCVERVTAGLRDIEIRNNLILAERDPDMVVAKSDSAAISTWNLGHNWRTARPAGGALSRMWTRVPTAMDDHGGPARLISTEPKDGDFLRPVEKSAVATEGVGGRLLPKYFGAIAPRGADPWDWQKTWDLRLR